MSLFLQVGYESYKLHKRSSTFVCLHVTRVRSSAREWKEKKTTGEINVFITEISVKAGTQYREYNVKKFKGLRREIKSSEANVERRNFVIIRRGWS